MLAYYFPPIGGAGVQRTVKFVRYLPQLFYEPVVLTGGGGGRGRWSPIDDTLADEIGAVEVIRVPEERLVTAGKWRARVDGWLDLETPFARGWRQGLLALGREQDVDLVYASMSPFETAEAARDLALALRVPWVADLRDPWALDEMAVYRSRFHRARALRRMRRILSQADAVVMNTGEAAARLRAFPEFAGVDVAVVTNGFDPEDFAGSHVPTATGPFRIVHTGYLHTDLGREVESRGRLRRLIGGAVDGVNILARSHHYLLEAIDRLHASGAPGASQIELHLAGSLTDEDREAARRPFVRMHPYLSHRESIKLMRGADLLFLPMHDLPDGQRATIVPGKTYEYLASNRPLLAAVPDGDARDLLDQAGSALLCRPTDVPGMARILEEQVERKRAGRPALRPDPTVLEPYERHRLTVRLANLFDRVLDRRSATGPVKAARSSRAAVGEMGDPRNVR
jgi:glycosyltransferase involved in cell wall biosynthesis